MHNPSRDLTRRQLLLLTAAVIALMTTAVGVYGLLAGPRHRSKATVGTAAARAARRPPTPPASGVATPDPASVALPHTDDAITYARSVAQSLFTWDTASGYLPSDYESPVLADADPSGEETAGLITDVATYLPTTDQWLDLATMKVAQTIEITSAVVPTDWQSVTNQSHGELRPGTSAVTITGIRHRTGDWNGRPATMTAPVAFTAFIACEPSFDRCHILRLSQPGDPLK